MFLSFFILNGLTADAADPSMALSNLWVYYMRPHTDWNVSKQLHNLTLGGVQNGIEIYPRASLTPGSPRVPKGSWERPKSDQMAPQSDLRAPERPKSVPRAAQERPRAPESGPGASGSDVVYFLNIQQTVVFLRFVVVLGFDRVSNTILFGTMTALEQPEAPQEVIV